MISIVFIAAIITNALANGAGTPITDLVGSVERKLDIRLPRPWYKPKFLGKIISYEGKSIKNHEAPKIFIKGYDVRVSDVFYNTHNSAKPSDGDISLISDLGEAVVDVTSDFKDWKYGKTRTLRTSNYVTLKRSTRLSKKDPWKVVEEAEHMIDLKVTKYRGAKKADGGYEQDILLVEEIAGLQDKLLPGSRAIYEPVAIASHGSENLIMSNMVLDNGYQIVASPKFVALHIKGAPGSFGHQHVGHKLITITSESVNFFIPNDLDNWAVGETRILKSNHYVNLQEMLRDTGTDSWASGKKFDRQIQVTATRLQRAETGHDRILIDKLEIIPGPLIDPYAKRLNRALLKTEPIVFGNVRCWALPLVKAEGAEIFATEEFITVHYYRIVGPQYNDMRVNIIPDDGFVLSSAGVDKMAEGQVFTVGTSTWAFKGQHKRENINADWQFIETTHFQPIFKGTKYLNPKTKSPVMVLSAIKSINIMPK